MDTQILQYPASVYYPIYTNISLVGGYTDPTVSSSCEVYCPRENTWTELTEMNMAKSALSQVVVPTHLLDLDEWRI